VASSFELRVGVGIIASVAIAFAAYQASSVFAPLALAIFVIAIVWPLQSRLQLHMPKLVALGVTLFLTTAVCIASASLAVWAFSRVGQSLIVDSARYQALYHGVVAWLDDHGVSVAGLWAEHFNVGWLLGAAQFLTGRINTTLTFWLIALTYLILGLLEVDDIRCKIRALNNCEMARVLLDGSAATAMKFRKYMLVRTQMSAVTGLLVGAFAWITGLPFAAEWGVIAFVLNYIPYIGPFIATLFPTLLAMTHFESWEAVLGMFVGLNIIQFAVGNYVEPRLAGSLLSVSPMVVLFAIFFWTFLWGLFGTFIGAPIALAIISFCGQHPSSRWVADLLGDPGRGETKQIKSRSAGRAGIYQEADEQRHSEEPRGQQTEQRAEGRI
jgi:AI-2 transport protein TqsA